MADLPPALLALLEPLVDLVADRVAKVVAARNDGAGYVDAKASGLGVRTFRSAARARGFPVYVVGRKWVAKRSDVEAYLLRQKVDFDRARAPEQPDAFDRALADGRLRVVGSRK